MIMVADEPTSAPATGWRVQLRNLVLLAAIVLISRGVYAARATAPARDSFRYFAAAKTFENSPLLIAINNIDVHPAYPYSLATVHQLALTVGFEDSPYLWWRGGQVWSIVCSLWFFVAAYCFGTLLSNPRTSCLGCALLALMPRQLTYAGDVISDNLTAALGMSSLLFAALGLRSTRPIWLLPAGILAALAYLSHLSGLIVVCGIAGVLGLCVVAPSTRRERRRWILSAAAFAVPMVFILTGYASVIGGLSPRLAAADVLGIPNTDAQKRIPEALDSANVGEASIAGNAIRLPATVAAAEEAANARILVDRPFVRIEGYDKLPFLPAAGRVLEEWGEETKVWMLLAAGAGIVWRRRMLAPWSAPAAWLVPVTLAASIAMMLLLQMRGGYLAGRYALVATPLVAIPAGAFILDVVAAISRRRFKFEPAWIRSHREEARRAALIAIVCTFAVALDVSGWLRPLHSARHGHMAAADWLRTHTMPEHVVFDPTGFATFFAARENWIPRPGIEGPLPFDLALIDPTMIYRMHKPTHDAIAAAVEHGKIVAEFPERPGGDTIGIYAVIPGGSAQSNAPARTALE